MSDPRPININLPLDRIEIRDEADKSQTRWTPGRDPSPAGKLEGGVADAVDDVLGHSLQFAGKDDRVVVDAIPGATDDDASQMLLEAWVQIAPQRRSKGPMSILGARSADLGFGLYADEKAFYFYQWEDRTTVGVVSRAAPEPGTWTHLAVAWDGAEMTLFVDGQAEATQPWDEAPPYCDSNAPRYLILGGASEFIDHRETVGFEGRIAQVRLQSSLPGTTGTLGEAVRHKIEVDLSRSSTGTLVPLEFSLQNDDLHPVLFLSDMAQGLTIELRNTGRQAIDLPDPGDTHAIELRFRPGALRGADQIKLAAPEASTPGGAWTLAHRGDAGGTDTLVLHAGKSDQLRPDETVRLRLEGLLPDRRGGVRTTRVQLRYHLTFDRRYPLEGSRVHMLSFVQLSEAQIQRRLDDIASSVQAVEKTQAGRTDPGKQVAELAAQVAALAETDKLRLQAGGVELAASVIGPASVLCDGVTPNRLLIRIANTSRLPIPLAIAKGGDPGSTFRVLLECTDKPDGEARPWQNVPWGLWQHGNVSSISSTMETVGWKSADKPQDGVVEVTNTGNAALGPAGGADGYLLIALKDFYCSGIPGQALLHIAYAGIGAPDRDGLRPSGHLAIPIQRTTVQSRTAGSGASRRPRTVIDGDITVARADRIFLHKAGLDKLQNAAGEIPLDDVIPNGKLPTRIELRKSGEAVAPPRPDALAEEKLVVAAREMVVATEQGLSYAGHPGHLVPRGTIVMWSNAWSKGKALDAASELDAQTGVPKGWVLCDGDNGTPNLRDRFIMGGHLENADKSGEGDSHNHYVGTSLSGTTSAEGRHTHGMDGWYCREKDSGSGATHTVIDSGGMGHGPHADGEHTHTVRLDLGTWTGSQGPLKPSYYILCFIMKL